MSPRFRVGIGSDLTEADGSSLLAEAVRELLEPVPGLELDDASESRGPS